MTLSTAPDLAVTLGSGWLTAKQELTAFWGYFPFAHDPGSTQHFLMVVESCG
jgi:hypothetical protein